MSDGYVSSVWHVRPPGLNAAAEYRAEAASEYLALVTDAAIQAVPDARINAAAQHQADAAIKAAAEYRESEWRRQEQAAEPRRYGMVPASEVTHLRAEVARLTAIIEGLLDVTPEPVVTPHPLLRAIRARPGNYGLAGLAN